jgi:hypothetical protein
LLGLELEGLSPQDQEFEAARQFTRFAGAAWRNAIVAPPTGPAAVQARAAVQAAAQQHAPGLLAALEAGAPHSSNGAGASGRWVRRGDVVELFGL